MDAVRPAEDTACASLEAGCLVLDAELHVHRWHGVVAHYAQLGAGEAEGRPLSAVLPNLPESWRAALGAVLADGEARILPGGGPFAAGAHRAVVTAFAVSVAGAPGIGICVVDAGSGANGTDTGDVPEIRRRLDELGMLEDPDFLTESLTEFQSNAEALLREILGAHATRRREDLARTAHRLAGSALTIGAASLGHMAARLEQRVTAGAHDLEAALHELHREAERVFAFCERLRT